MRIGVFGGSFDPIHYGHLLLAECCREQRQLESVWFVPAATPPHKVQHLRTTGNHRARMIQLAIADHESFRFSGIELDRGGVSYTVDTLAEVQRLEPSAKLYLLLGADMLAELPTWHRPADICRQATLLVVQRAGSPDPDFQAVAELVPPDRLEQFRALCVQMPPVGISSTAIRRRVAAGQSIRYYTTPDAARYIGEEGLYRNADNP